MKKITLRILLLILVVSFVAAFFAGCRRVGLEKGNKTVELVMDLADIKQLSLLDGESFVKALLKFKKRGITSIAITEETIALLKQRGLLSFERGFERETTVVPQAYYLTTENAVVYQMLRRSFRAVLPKNQMWEVEEGKVLAAMIDPQDLEELGVGIYPPTYNYLAKFGFFIVPRLKNSLRLTAKKIGAKIGLLKDVGPFATIIFAEEEVMGFPSNIRVTAKSLKENDLYFGCVDISVQKGDVYLAKLMGDKVTRVHSISEEEMEDMDLARAEARMLRAVDEREVRLLYIRPTFRAARGKSLLTTNLDYVGKLHKKLAKRGFAFGLASHPGKFKTGIFSLLLISLGIASGGLLLWDFLFGGKAYFQWGILLLTLVLTLLFQRSIGGSFLWRKILALAAAIIFPTLAIVSQFSWRKSLGIKPVTIGKAVLLVVRVTFISAFGALLIIGLLVDTNFMLGAQKFMGVKIAFLLPLLIVAGYYLFFGGERLQVKKTIANTLDWLRTPLTMAYAVGALLALLFLVVYVLRSGNFGLPTLGLERRFRDFLENILWARPRTKEFLIGYPALFLAAVYYFFGGRRWLWLLLAAGAVSQVSLLNTFCHIHSALGISVVRSFYGLILGVIIGACLFGLYQVGKNWYNKL